MNDRKSQQAVELVGVLLFVAFVGFAFLVAVLVGAVGGRTDRSTEGDASNWGAVDRCVCPHTGTAACWTGGWRRVGVCLPYRLPFPPPPPSHSPVVGSSGESPTPATSRTSEESSPVQPAITPTVIISAQPPPPATAVTSPRAVETIAPVSNTLEAQVRASRWPASLYATVICIVQRESKGDPNAVGAALERGYLQLHPANRVFLESRGYAWDSLFDPIVNLNAGYELYLYWGSLAPWGGGCR